MKAFVPSPDERRRIAARVLGLGRREPTTREREELAAARRRKVEAVQRLYAEWLTWMFGGRK